jgi:hypothetical protein
LRVFVFALLGFFALVVGVKTMMWMTWLTS